jgi:hypothetical protein
MIDRHKPLLLPSDIINNNNLDERPEASALSKKAFRPTWYKTVAGSRPNVASAYAAKKLIVVAAFTGLSL